MKIINNIYSQFKTLSWLAVRIIQATICIFCVILICTILLMLFPDITSNPVQNIQLVNELLNTSTRLLTLGIVTAFVSDIIIRI